MHTQTRFERIIFLTLFGLLTACSSTPSSERSPSSKDALTLSLTSHRYLELEPCGCSLVDYGGMAREYNLLQKNRVELGKENFWHFYTGVSFTRIPAETSRISEKALAKKQDTFLRALNHIAPKAALFDAEDFGYGVAKLQQWKEGAEFPFLNASVVDKASKKPFFEPFIKLQWRQKKILVVGISEAPTKKSILPKNLTWLPPTAAIDAVLKKAGKDFDLIVVLSSLNKPDRSVVAQKVAQLPIVYLGGPHGALETNYARIEAGNLLYLNSLERGRGVGELALNWPAGPQRALRFTDGDTANTTPAIAFESSVKGITKELDAPENAVSTLIQKYHEEMAISVISDPQPVR